MSEQRTVPYATGGCDECSVEPGEKHRSAGCMGVRIGDALCAEGIHQADGTCCPAGAAQTGDAR